MEYVRLTENMWFRKMANYILLCLCLIFVSGCATLVGPGTISPEETVAKPSLEEILAEGDKAMQKGDIKSAKISFALALERDQSNVSAAYKLALVHGSDGSLPVAERLLRHAISLDATHMPSRSFLGLVLIQLERAEEAEKVFQQVLDTNPNFPEALNGLGIVSDMRADHIDAQAHFKRALELSPRSAKIANNLGYSYYLDGDYTSAENYFRDAIKYDDDYNRAWSNLALIYTRTGRLSDADAAFRKIVPEHKAANNIGYLGLLQGDRELAKAQLDRAVNIAPSYYEVANRNLEVVKDENTLLADDAGQ